MLGHDSLAVTALCLNCCQVYGWVLKNATAKVGYLCLCSYYYFYSTITTMLPGCVWGALLSAAVCLLSSSWPQSACYAIGKIVALCCRRLFGVHFQYRHKLMLGCNFAAGRLTQCHLASWLPAHELVRVFLCEDCDVRLYVCVESTQLRCLCLSAPGCMCSRQVVPCTNASAAGCRTLWGTVCFTASYWQPPDGIACTTDLLYVQ